MKKSYSAISIFLLIFIASSCLNIAFGWMIFSQKNDIDHISKDLISNLTTKSLEGVKLAVELSAFRQELERSMFSEDDSLKNEAKFNAETSFDKISKVGHEEIKQIAHQSIKLIQLQDKLISDVAKTEWMLLDGVLQKKIGDISTSSFENINFSLEKMSAMTERDKSLTRLFLIASVIFQITVLTVIYRIFIKPLYVIEGNIDIKSRGAPPTEKTDLRIKELSRLNEAILMLHHTTKENVNMHVSVAKEMERAKKIAEDKAEFMSSMNHEINTPLATIGILTYLIDKNNTNSNLQQHLEKLKSTVNYLNSLVERILKLSRMDANKYGLELTQVDLSRIADTVHKIVEPVASKKGVVFTIEIQENVPRCLIGDSVNIQEIILNYATNAVKFTQHGSVNTKIAALSVADNAAEIKISVSDTGCGINPDEMHSLFQRFSQLHKRKFSGSGLGLAITKGLVELMGGTVGVSSEVGKGSIFWACVRLPICNKDITNGLRVTELSSQQAEQQPLIINSTLRSVLLDIYICAKHDWRIAASIWSSNEHQFASYEGPYFTKLAELLKSFLLPDAVLHLESLLGKNESHPIPAAISESDKPTVLLIDDTPENLDTYGLLLDDISIVKVSVDPARGIDIAKRNPDIKLILLDISMPVICGFDVMKTLKADMLTENIPVIMISASELPGTHEKCIEAGAVAFIDRSKSPESLLDLAKHYLNIYEKNRNVKVS